MEGHHPAEKEVVGGTVVPSTLGGCQASVHGGGSAFRVPVRLSREAPWWKGGCTHAGRVLLPPVVTGEEGFPVRTCAD